MAFAGSPSFPRLTDANHRVTSPPDESYNCIAWAAEEITRWWWPDPAGGYYWPPELPLQETVDNFRKAFEILGYEVCLSAEAEDGYQKVAIFQDPNGVPTHAARQLTDGTWTSKLGRLEDIGHNRSDDVEGPAYGTVALVLRRPLGPTTH